MIRKYLEELNESTRELGGLKRREQGPLGGTTTPGEENNNSTTELTQHNI